MKTKIYCPDIECDSCIKILNKRINELQGVESFKINEDNIEIEFDESLIKEDNIIGMIINSGFRASKNPFERKTFKERLRHLKENKPKYLIEMLSIKYAFWIFLILIGFEAIAYIGFLKNIPGFLNRYGLWILYSNLSIASIGGAIWHFYSYKTKITCMLGMMIGMTIGMQSGMMIGAILGATNGFFIGALIGMILAVLVGAITGRCCGVMGIMEGMMAGVMGGTMGPMISVMMLADNIHIFMPFYMVINIIITWGLIYLVYEEAIEGKSVEKRPIDFSYFASWCILIASALIILMIYGPKSPLVSF